MSTASPEPLIGVINAGSSSVKFSFYEGDRRILTGQVEGIGAHPSAMAEGPDGEKLAAPDLGTKPPTVPSEVLPAILPWAREKLGHRRLAALGHRVGHGGLHHSRPPRVTISRANSRVAAYVIKTDENLMIARHARALVGG
jgi:acetate kinase